jgi:hypothetical protein
MLITREDSLIISIPYSLNIPIISRIKLLEIYNIN